MIDRIRTIIENNETADMKKYGYEIVPDSTIPELTNEFTFTEQRVINKITWKSGIIRIYARDYYFNGNCMDKIISCVFSFYYRREIFLQRK